MSDPCKPKCRAAKPATGLTKQCEIDRAKHRAKHAEKLGHKDSELHTHLHLKLHSELNPKLHCKLDPELNRSLHLALHEKSHPQLLEKFLVSSLGSIDANKLHEFHALKHRELLRPMLLTRQPLGRGVDGRIVVAGGQTTTYRWI